MADVITSPDSQKVFDDRHPPSQEIIEKCVHCGFCLPTCPTYALWGEEADSPRGRIYLMKLASEGAAEMTPQWVSHFDACLGCMACTSACPSGVDYEKLIVATRAQIERRYHRPAGDKLRRRFLFAMFTNPARLNLLRWPLGAYQKSGVQSLLRSMRLFNLLPKSLRALDSLLPRIHTAEPIPERTPARGEQRKRVGLLLGCVQRAFFSHVNAATVRVLAAEGCEVIAPLEQSCCGALMVHAGEEEQAQELARKTIQAFEHANVDIIVTNAAGCGSTIKQYGHLLRDDPVYAERAGHLAAKCKDISEVLVDLQPRAKRQPLRVLAALHDACHLQHAQNVRSQPRSLLAGIPGLQLTEIPEAPICCGSAGIYNLVQPDTARDLGDRKARLISTLHPDVVATGNPGCILQLQSALARAGKKIPVMHTIELLDASLRGRPLDEILK